MALYRTVIYLLGAALLSLNTPVRSAEPYPVKPIRFIVPWPPGGGTDAVARVVGQRVSETLGKPVIIENRGGAGTIIGIDAALKAEPDGYTFGFPTSSFAVNASLQPKLPYDTLGDFEPVSLIGTGLYVLVAHPSVKAETLDQFTQLLREAPGDIAAGFTGHGSPSHLGLVEYLRRTGTKPIDVNYRGTGPAVAALLGGEIKFLFTTLPSSLSHIQSGRLRALALTSSTRTDLLPDLPTASESGLNDFVVYEWYGLMAPKGTPRDRVDRMNAAIRQVLALPDLQARIRSMGAEPVQDGSPEQFGKFVAAEVEKWGKLIRESNIKPE